MKASTERLVWIGGGLAVLVGGIAALTLAGRSTPPSPPPSGAPPQPPPGAYSGDPSALIGGQGGGDWGPGAIWKVVVYGAADGSVVAWYPCATLDDAANWVRLYPPPDFTVYYWIDRTGACG